MRMAAIEFLAPPRGDLLTATASEHCGRRLGLTTRGRNQQEAHRLFVPLARVAERLAGAGK